jgi:hypothetical protein
MNEQAHQPKDTPRTNAAAIEINRPGEGDKLDWPSFARHLERRLDRAEKLIQRVLDFDVERPALAGKPSARLVAFRFELKDFLDASGA